MDDEEYREIIIPGSDEPPVIDPDYQRGDRVVLDRSSDPHTDLQPGDTGTVWRYDPDQRKVTVVWDTGSRLAILLGQGDAVHLLDPAASPAPITTATAMTAPGRPPAGPGASPDDQSACAGSAHAGSATTRNAEDVADDDQIARVTTSYAGERIDWHGLTAAHRHGGFRRTLAAELARAVSDIDVVESELSALTGWLRTDLAATRAALDARPGQPAPTLDHVHGLATRGPRVGVLASVHRERVNHLRVLVRLWRAHHATAATGDGDHTHHGDHADQDRRPDTPAAGGAPARASDRSTAAPPARPGAWCPLC